MKYPYTWNHINLIAKLCESKDDNDSITASWISIVESHHSTTFPFTLWPLTYRTSDVTTSPSISTPVFLRFNTLVCNIDVKMYICNEVIIVCVQNDEISDKTGATCISPCHLLSVNSSPSEDHSVNHTEDSSFKLLPCNICRIYPIIKEGVLPYIQRFHAMSNGAIECIICTGHGISGSIASCIAADIGQKYEVQKNFLGLDEKLVKVDLIAFASRPLASSVYWRSIDNYIDHYLTIDTNTADMNTSHLLVPNPRGSNTIVGGINKQKRLSSMSKFRSKFGSDKPIIQETEIQKIISEIDKLLKI